MRQVHAGAYVSLLTPGGTNFSDCHPRKTTTYILHVVSITTHTHDRRSLSQLEKKKQRKEKKIKERKEKRRKTKQNEKGKQREEKDKKSKKRQDKKARKKEGKKRRKKKKTKKKKNVILADPRNWLRMALG